MEFTDIKLEKPKLSECGRDFLVKIKISTGYEYQVAEWFDPGDGESEPFFNIQQSWGGQQMLTKEIVGWVDFNENQQEKTFVAYTTFLKESVKHLLLAEKSIVKNGYVKISLDEDYKCSDADLGKYKIEYKYPLHLIHLGQDLHRADLKLSEDLKRKWFVH